MCCCFTTIVDQPDPAGLGRTEGDVDQSSNFQLLLLADRVPPLDGGEVDLQPVQVAEGSWRVHESKQTRMVPTIGANFRDNPGSSPVESCGA